MTTKEKIDENPFNSDYEEKLLLDELISTPSNNEHMFTSHSSVFTHIHEKAHYDNICKIAPNIICEKNKKGFKQKLMVKKQVKGRRTTCLLRR
jgi:hypothetical protein